MSRLEALRSPGRTVAAALVGLAVLVGVATVLTPDVTAVDHTPVLEPVASTELTCALTVATDALTSTVTAGVASLPSVKDGVATLADLSTKADSKPLVITKPGQSVTRVFTGESGSAQLARATGSFAQGFGADQAVRSGQGSTRGLAAQPCARPVTDAWLMGGGSTVGRLTQVVLVNDDDRPAQVDLLVYGTGGPVSTPSASGIVLAAGSRKQVRLDAIAPGQKLVAVHVVARSGRIGVVGLDQESLGLIPEGIALLPPTEAGTRLVVPGVPGFVRTRHLELLSPDVDTTADISILTPDGPITPVGIGSVALEAGKVVSLPLEEAMAGESGGILIRSATPVVAGVEVRTGGGRALKEKDSLAATPRLSAPGIVVGLAGGNLKHAVLLSAPATEARVRLELYVAGRTEPSWTESRTVAAGSYLAVTVPVASASASSILLVIPEGGGPVYAARQVTEAGARGPMIGLAPILPQRASTLVPAIVAQPGSSVPGVTSN